MPRTAQRGRAGLAIDEILAWADAHHRRTGAWPLASSGPVRGGRLGETWRNIDTALRIGLRGLEGGTSLPQLLAEMRQVRNRGALPPLKIPQILAWAEAHHRRHASWPHSDSGPIDDAAGETWRAVDQALRVGTRRLPGGHSLAQLLADERGVRNLHRLPRLTIPTILTWIDAHHARTGHWPTSESGPVLDEPGETWKGVASALRLGRRGLRGGTSLPRLLKTERGARNPKQLPPLSVPRLLSWARAHRRRAGDWPTRSSGAIPEAPGETWSAIHAALTCGCRGLPAGLTLAGLVKRQAAEPPPSSRPRLTVARILAWADAHHERTGEWPHARCGPVQGVKDETWRTVDQALHKDLRGLKLGITLAELLSDRRGLRYRQHLPPLKEAQILAWADAHLRRTGQWPNFRSGPVPGTSGETWRGIDTALGQGVRGLRGGRTLAQFLAERRDARNRRSLPPLRPARILAWAKDHRQRTGSWPTSNSGPVHAAEGETWKGVEMALRWGYRGLPRGTTLARLLAQELGVRNRTSLPLLSDAQIIGWAEDHRRRHGEWPTRSSGAIPRSGGETWNGIEQALRTGYRGLPGGKTLASLMNGR